MRSMTIIQEAPFSDFDIIVNAYSQSSVHVILCLRVRLLTSGQQLRSAMGQQESHGDSGAADTSDVATATNNPSNQSQGSLLNYETIIQCAPICMLQIVSTAPYFPSPHEIIPPLS